jgi:hypothetical protein
MLNATSIHMYWAIRAIVQVILLNAHTCFIPQSQAQIKS